MPYALQFFLPHSFHNITPHSARFSFSNESSRKSEIPLQVDLEGDDWKERVVELLRQEGNLAEVAISSETHFQFGVSNPTFYFVEFYLKKTSISISHALLPKYMCFSLNWTSEVSMQVVHQNPLIFSKPSEKQNVLKNVSFHVLPLRPPVFHPSRIPPV